jgi:predicted RNA-binding Zn ribbon-like protein
MRDLLRNALRRNLQRARLAGDTARAERLERLLNPPVAKPAVVEEVLAPRSRRRQKEVETAPAVVSPEPEAWPVELPPEAPAEAEE